MHGILLGRADEIRLKWVVKGRKRQNTISKIAETYVVSNVCDFCGRLSLRTQKNGNLILYTSPAGMSLSSFEIFRVSLTKHFAKFG